ncbi:beta-lactamase family protein [Halolamina sp. CBA1230]|uniref:serine hydrolase domain-containing protein n=1 Tax=Halolamina sp. CBA1230 TaxID=1853690 RepID=UPI0009A22127|nr:serine hydrolase domain-containing protein [Halolamina sp. CBA1230]QKY19239.1 beta-lactamase family protein [Halolamina sp. CBA1230]
MKRALSRRRFIAGVGASTAAAAAGVPTATADGGSPPAAAVQTEIGSTLDELVPASLDEHDVPGATVAVVDGDETITRGYGVADRESGDEVDPARTAFRVGSVSKSVTATALMNRAQRGEIDPEAPIAESVDAAMAPERSATLAELITHRGGFESSNRGLWLPGAESLRPLAAYLREEPQAQVRAPGTVGAYSNFGYALAGQALATADQPFARAIEAELLDPAGMTGSSFRQPLPEAVADGHASGHGSGGASGPDEFPLVGLRPAGSLSATADDMARFLELHLHDGAVGGEQVLEPGTVSAMHEQWATHHDRLDGMGFGLIEDTREGTRTLWHNGGTPSFYSHFVLVPEQEFGLFVSFNASNGQAAAGDVIDGVLDELLADAESASLSPEGTPTRADELGGTYRALDHSYTWHDRATSVLNAPTITVSVADDGALLTDTGGGTNRWIEIEPLVFEHEDGGERLAFGEGDGGIEYLFSGGSPTAYGRVDTVDNLTAHGVFLLCTFLGLLSADVGWSGRSLYERGRAALAGDREDAWATLLGTRLEQARSVTEIAGTATIGGVVLMVIHLMTAPYLTISDPPLTFRLLFAGPLLGLVGAVVAVGYAAALWLAGEESRFERARYTLVAASLVGVCWQLQYWNLLFPPA